MSTSSILKISQLNIPSPLLVLVGPTAVGKTETSLVLAERLGAEIVSVDSRLFYRGMDIGTAKPTLAEQSRAPHHLIDVADPDQNWSLAEFQRAARDAIAAIHARDRLPILVGGTGQYVRAVIEGWELPPQEADPHLRDALERWGKAIGAQELHRRLVILDPQAADLIDWQNMRRTIRALEVTLRTGRPFSTQRQRAASPYSLLMVGLKRPRPELYSRVDERIETMLAGGLLDEVRGLLAKGYSPRLPTMSAIGYREMIAYLQGEIALEEAVMLMKRQTRRFVRHQGAWFNEKDPLIHWFDAGPQAAGQIEALVRSARAWLPPGAPLSS